jgi:hypothetical protein
MQSIHPDFDFSNERMRKGKVSIPSIYNLSDFNIEEESERERKKNDKKKNKHKHRARTIMNEEIVSILSLSVRQR